MQNQSQQRLINFFTRLYIDEHLISQLYNLESTGIDYFFIKKKGKRKKESDYFLRKISIKVHLFTNLNMHHCLCNSIQVVA